MAKRHFNVTDAELSTAENLYSSGTMKHGERNLLINVSMSLWEVMAALKYVNLKQFTRK